MHRHVPPHTNHRWNFGSMLPSMKACLPCKRSTDYAKLILQYRPLARRKQMRKSKNVINATLKAKYTDYKIHKESTTHSYSHAHTDTHTHSLSLTHSILSNNRLFGRAHSYQCIIERAFTHQEFNIHTAGLSNTVGTILSLRRMRMCMHLSTWKRLCVHVEEKRYSPKEDFDEEK